MADNSQKIALTTSLNSFAKKKYLNRLQLEGKALPATVVSVKGWIVTVDIAVTSKFTIPQLTIPVASSEYDYLPLQKGDGGLVLPADAYLGGLSGLGGGTARLGLVPNLSALVFVPVGNEAWPTPSNPNQRIVQGPKGAILQTSDGSVSVVVDKDSGKVTITGELWVNGKKYLNHEHSGVQSGSSDSGPVIDP